MRVLLVGEDTNSLDAARQLVEGAGHEVAGESAAIEVTAAVRRLFATAVLASVAGDSRALRRFVERVRHAAESSVPVVLLLPEDAAWLRVGPPVDLAPLAVLPQGSATAIDLQRVLAWAGDAFARSEPGWQLGDGATFDRATREIRGAGAAQRLTPSEAVILGLLVEAAGRTVEAGALSLALWRTAEVDSFARAAIRSHVHTLRKKLAALGLDQALASNPRVGYRWIGTAAAGGRGGVEVSPRPSDPGRTAGDPARPSLESAASAAPRTPGAAPR